MSASSRSDRRRFLRTVGLAGVTSALTLPALSGSRPARAQAPAVPPAPDSAKAAAPDSAKAAPPAIGEDARALAGIVERRYGAHLSKQQLESIARDFDGDLKATKRLREVKLGNSVEPDFTFRA